MLMRNVTYEVPALKKQIAKCQQVQKVTTFMVLLHHLLSYVKINCLSLYTETHFIFVKK